MGEGRGNLEKKNKEEEDMSDHEREGKKLSLYWKL